jgi:hypothetical protein
MAFAPLPLAGCGDVIGPCPSVALDVDFIVQATCDEAPRRYVATDLLRISGPRFRAIDLERSP